MSLGSHLSFMSLHLRKPCSVFSSEEGNVNTSHVGLLEYFLKAEIAKFACKIIIRMCPHAALSSEPWELCCVV